MFSCVLYLIYFNYYSFSSLSFSQILCSLSSKNIFFLSSLWHLNLFIKLWVFFLFYVFHLKKKQKVDKNICLSFFTSLNFDCLLLNFLSILFPFIPFPLNTASFIFAFVFPLYTFTTLYYLAFFAFNQLMITALFWFHFCFVSFPLFSHNKSCTLFISNLFWNSQISAFYNVSLFTILVFFLTFF